MDDLRRRLTLRNTGGVAPSGQGSPNLPLARRSTVARASLLRGGPSDARRNHEALVKIKAAEEVSKMLEVSMAAISSQHSRSSYCT
jgi:hypothetical protein